MSATRMPCFSPRKASTSAGLRPASSLTLASCRAAVAATLALMLAGAAWAVIGRVEAAIIRAMQYARISSSCFTGTTHIAARTVAPASRNTALKITLRWSRLSLIWHP